MVKNGKVILEYCNTKKEKEKTVAEEIGIITFYYRNKNFGGLLQAYALQKVIESESDCKCEQISYAISKTPIKQRILNAIKYMPLSKIITLIVVDMFWEKIIHLLSASEMNELTKERKKAFELFEKNIPHSKDIYTYQNIGKCGQVYGVYVVGSDQIWNAGIDLETFLLKFVSNTAKKISYAASSGGVDFKGREKKLIKEELINFDAISVREISLGKQLNDLTNLRIQTVIDPVFLLTRKEWNNIAEVPSMKEPYILCYLLGNSKKQRKIAEMVSKRMECKLVVFPYIVDNSFHWYDLKFGDVRDYTSGPKQFLGLIRDAEFIITDSFHAMAFSVIFEKKFCVFSRKTYGKICKSNNRITDFLEKIGIENRIAEKEEDVIELIGKCVDYDIVMGRLQNWIDNSKQWLQRALKDA